MQLRASGGAPLGDVFSFLSGLYFRGKLTYARAFATPEFASIRIITTDRGLLGPEVSVRPGDLEAFACVDLSEAGEEFLGPLMRDAVALERSIPPDAAVVLLGSIATNKYVGPLTKVFGQRLVFPPDFIGRGDMSRGGLLLRAATSGLELEYIPVENAVRHGKRPPKLEPLRSGKPTKVDQEMKGDPGY
jgi:hypothetical protein